MSTHVALIGAELEESLAVRYLWGALERAGHRVTLIVFNSEDDTDAAARQLVDSGAQLAGLSMVFTWRAREFAKLAEAARSLGYDGHIVAGGHFAAFHARELLRDVPAIDSVAQGEGEEIIVALAASLDELAGVEGLVWRDGVRVVDNAPARKPPDLDELAEPKRMVPFDEFVGLPIVNMLSSRGCTHHCAFCSIAAWHRMCGGERYRARRPEHVADEMARLYQQGVRIFNFHDDNFVAPERQQMLERIETIHRELDRRGVGPIALALKSRPGAVDEEVFSALKRLGLFRVFLGIEAGTPESLRQLGRRQTVEENRRALRIVNQLDLHACFNLLLLNPESTLEDLAGNIAFLRRHPHNPMNFCRTEIYTGTPLERRLRRRGRLLGDYWGWDYRIADARAQTACEVIMSVFDSRNYGEHCLHHRVMHVDYEHQLLAQFYGTTADLRERVKQYIAVVNLDTCAHLDGIAQDVAAGRASSDQPWVAQLYQRIEADNDRLLRDGNALLAEIRCAADDRAAGGPGWTRKATAAAVAASITLAAAACDDPRTPLPMPEEIALTTAPKLPRDAAAPDASATGDAATDAAPAELPIGTAELIYDQFKKEELAKLSKQVRPAQEIVIELWIDGEGKVSRIEIRDAKLPEANRKAIEERLLKWKVDNPKARNQRFVLTFTTADLTAAQAQPRPVPRPEMVAPRPRPVPRPEMVPPRKR